MRPSGRSTKLGEYVVAVTLLDAAGNTSETLEAAVALVADGGAQGPSIDGFKPATASAGDEVVVRGSGLDVEGLTLEVGGIEAAILGADAEGLRILMPAVDTPGRLVAIGPAGTGLSSTGPDSPSAGPSGSRSDRAAGGRIRGAERGRNRHDHRRRRGVERGGPQRRAGLDLALKGSTHRRWEANEGRSRSPRRA